MLPQWNSGPDGHVGLAKLLNRFGISALRMTMAYHAERKPAEMQRADYHVSSNVGRTIHAGRQSVIDIRACMDWLAAQGYSGSAFWAPAWDHAWRSSRRPTTRGSGWESSITSRCTSPTWSGPGYRPRTCARGSGTRQPGRLAAVLGRDQPGQLPEALAGPGAEEAVDLGPPRFHLSARLLAAGARTASASWTCRTRCSSCPAATTPPGQFPFKLHGRSGDVPVRGREPVT